ncbi:hypothetical protein F7725_005668 [Dissostichus mawsoni]|uniref:Uncharacterized protein n=1 Tax=Dissostichus mawsoni TaxID=36200 RepID=A0A7J5YT58_DISMA|nr:hypothetical protein F7725_005668 [Dissostichus mawsoni]
MLSVMAGGLQGPRAYNPVVELEQWPLLMGAAPGRQISAHDPAWATCRGEQRDSAGCPWRGTPGVVTHIDEARVVAVFEVVQHGGFVQAAPPPPRLHAPREHWLPRSRCVLMGSILASWPSSRPVQPGCRPRRGPQRGTAPGPPAHSSVPSLLETRSRTRYATCRKEKSSGPGEYKAHHAQWYSPTIQHPPTKLSPASREVAPHRTALFFGTHPHYNSGI